MNGCYWVAIKLHLQKQSPSPPLFDNSSLEVTVNNTPADGFVDIVALGSSPEVALLTMQTTPLSQGRVWAGRSLDPWDPGAADWTTDLECFSHDLMKLREKESCLWQTTAVLGFLSSTTETNPDTWVKPGSQHIFCGIRLLQTFYKSKWCLIHLRPLDTSLSHDFLDIRPTIAFIVFLSASQVLLVIKNPPANEGKH